MMMMLMLLLFAHLHSLNGMHVALNACLSQYCVSGALQQLQCNSLDLVCIMQTCLIVQQSAHLLLRLHICKTPLRLHFVAERLRRELRQQTAPKGMNDIKCQLCQRCFAPFAGEQ